MSEKENPDKRIEPVEVPLDKLNNDTLEGIIKDFILREGTDYGSTEFSLETKISQVRSNLESNKAKIYFDPNTETCTILTPQQVRNLTRII